MVFHINSYNKLNHQTAVTGTLPAHMKATEAPKIHSIPQIQRKIYVFFLP